MTGYRAEMVITTTSSTSAGGPSSHRHGPSCRCRAPNCHFPDHHGRPIRDRRGDREWGPVRYGDQHWRSLWWLRVQERPEPRGRCRSAARQPQLRHLWHLRPRRV